MKLRFRVHKLEWNSFTHKITFEAHVDIIGNQGVLVGVCPVEMAGIAEGETLQMVFDVVQFHEPDSLISETSEKDFLHEQASAASIGKYYGNDGVQGFPKNKGAMSPKQWQSAVQAALGMLNEKVPNPDYKYEKQLLLGIKSKATNMDPLKVGDMVVVESKLIPADTIIAKLPEGQWPVGGHVKIKGPNLAGKIPAAMWPKLKMLSPSAAVAVDTVDTTKEAVINIEAKPTWQEMLAKAGPIQDSYGNVWSLGTVFKKEDEPDWSVPPLTPFVDKPEKKP